MTIRTKTILLIGTTLVLMIILISSILQVILLKGYANLERQHLSHNILQIKQLLTNELEQIESVAGDWAPWDETYEFMLDRNEEYIENNLSDSTVENLPVDFLIYIGTDGSIVTCKFLESEERVGAPCPDSLAGIFFQGSSFYEKMQVNGEVAGVLVLQKDAVVVASAPILTSKFEGPARGFLVVGRYINDREIEHLNTKIDLKFSLHRLEELSETISAIGIAMEEIPDREEIVVSEINEATIAAYAVIPDVYNNPGMLLKVVQSRAIFAQGKASLLAIIVSILVTGLVFIGVTLLFLEKTILAKIVRLNREVKSLGDEGDLTKKITVTGNDEFADLSNEMNRMIESIRISTERDKAILDTMEDGYFEFDLNGNLTFSNGSLIKLLGYEKEDVDKISYRRLLNLTSDKKDALSAFRKLYKTGNTIKTMETGFTLADGSQVFLESTVSIIKDISGATIGFRGITRDVTARRKAAEELTYLVNHDILTGLLNRKAFQENLEIQLRYAERYIQERSLLFIDLDNFKTVNDSFGHSVGDLLLQEFSKRVGYTLRNTDNFYRIGGDEFVVILLAPQDQSPETVAQRILNVFNEPFHIQAHTIDYVTASIGISVYPLNGKDAESLILYADQLMYKAKNTRNTYRSDV